MVHSELAARTRIFGSLPHRCLNLHDLENRENLSRARRIERGRRFTWGSLTPRLAILIEFGAEPDQRAAPLRNAYVRGGEKSGHGTELCFSPRAGLNVCVCTRYTPGRCVFLPRRARDAFSNYHRSNSGTKEHPGKD